MLKYIGSISADEPIPEDRLTTLVKQPSEQFSYWRDLMAPVAEVEQDRQPGEGFRGTFRGHDLGKIHLASIQVDAMRYKRSRQSILKTGLDHWQIVLRRRGQEISRSGSSILRSGPGSLDLRSYTMPVVSNSSDSDLICVWLNRDDFPGMAALLDAASHEPLQGAMKYILQEFILSLERHRSRITPKDVPVIVSSLTALLAAAVSPSGEKMEAAATPIHASLFELARKYIDANLASPSLDTESLCSSLNISRRKLYYLFARKGGVAKYIRQQRLAACRMALENAADERLISTIAYSYGFSDPAQFSRLFRAQYGYSPREAREAIAFPRSGPNLQPANFQQWLSQTGFA